MHGLLLEGCSGSPDPAWGDVVNITTDPDDGHPVSVEIDWNVAAIDDEACYRITDFVPSM